ncbi:MAG: ABC transporter ATP-binding protein [Parcubacteria group bacterium]|nr:ABC transporter ATP-binding protein [Parcubacteria group bacterium]
MTKQPKAPFRQGFKIVFGYLEDHRKEITVISVLGLIGAAVGAIVPYLGGKIIDSILSEEILRFGGYEIAALYFFVLIFFVVKVIQELSGWRLNLKSDKLSALLEAEYMTKNASKILDLPLSFHKKYKIGEISHKINRASGAMETILGRIVVDFAPEFLSVVFAAILIFNINIPLASIIVGSVLIYGLFLTKAAPKLVPLQRKMHNLYNKAYGDAYDAITNIHSVKQATAENYEKKKLKTNFVNKAAKSWTEYIEIWQSLTLAQRIIIIFTQLAIYLISFNLIRNGQMTIGQLVMFNGYSAMFFGPFVRLGTNWQWLQNGLVNLTKAEELTKQQPENYTPKKITELDDIKGGIEFKNVSFSYADKKKRVILDDIDFKAKAGEIIALVGESGVGKTTLIDLISLYYLPTKGKVLVDGIDNQKLDLKFLRSKIAVVPQDITLFNDTAKNNIRYGSFSATDKEIVQAAKMAHADHFIKTFPKKYEQLVGERGIKLSTGQRQRIALARAFLRNPKILILDEPTSALDAKSEAYIQDALAKLMERKTTFIIAHRLSTVRKADKIIVLEKGKIAEIGKHEELLQKEDGIYRKLYELQIGFLK